MNIMSFINLFDKIPEIRIATASTYPHRYVYVNDPYGGIIYHVNKNTMRSKGGFCKENSINSVYINDNGIFIIADAFHCESGSVTFRDILAVFSYERNYCKGYTNHVKIHIYNYNKWFKYDEYHLPKFITNHPDILDRQVMAINIIDHETIGIRLDYDFNSLFDIYY